jgi:hypothetical protein
MWIIITLSLPIPICRNMEQWSTGVQFGGVMVEYLEVRRTLQFPDGSLNNVLLWASDLGELSRVERYPVTVLVREVSRRLHRGVRIRQLVQRDTLAFRSAAA